MSLSEMQACLGRLYLDATFRRLFADDPDAALEEYQLSSRERAAIDGIDRRSLEHFAQGLERKLRRRTLRAFPLSSAVGSERLERIFTRFYSLHPQDPHSGGPERLQSFGHFLEECLATDPEAPPFAADVARFERLHLAAAAAPPVPAAPDTHLRPEARPVRSPGVQVGEFNFDVIALEPELREGRLPERVETGHHIYAFVPPADQSIPAAVLLSPAARLLLELCDGQRDVGALRDEVERRTNRSGLDKQVRAALTTLREQQLVTY